MEKQYCKVGTSKPMIGEDQAIVLLEYLYQNFKDKSTQIKYSNSKLAYFFEQKALKLKKLLDQPL